MNKEEDDEGEAMKNIKDAIMPAKSGNRAFSISRRETLQDLLDSDSEEDVDPGPRRFINAAPELSSTDSLGHVNGIRQRIPSAGPSRRQTVTKIKSPISQRLPSSDSDTEGETEKKREGGAAGEYDPNYYQNLEVNDEIRELFQYITKYTPQSLNLDFKLRPFIPDFIPAVGDIDAFLKVVPPDVGIAGEPFTPDRSHLGLTVLDEPSANQSDAALLHLQLRATSVNVSRAANLVVKKVDNVEKNSKTIDKWIKDITDLHRSKSSPVVKYTDPMPDFDDLMQEWPEQMENLLKNHGFPNFKFCQSLSHYILIVCCIFDIPVYKNKIQSLHLLFSLYAAIKNSQLYQAANNEQCTGSGNEKHGVTDQLVLE